MKEDIIYSFTIEETEKPLQQIFLKPGEIYKFGRSPKCDYVINKQTVSSLQATLICKDKEVVLVLDGNGTKVSRNGVYDSEGDPISNHKNLNPGELFYPVLETDYHVRVTFLESEIESEYETIEHPTGNLEVKELKNQISELKTLVKAQMATSKVSHKAHKMKGDEILVNEGTLRDDIQKINSKINKIEDDIDGVKKVNNAQTKSLYLLVGLGMLWVGLSNGAKNLSDENFKVLLDKIESIGLVAIGGATLVRKNKEDEN